MDYVARLHLKTNTDFRQEMVDFCLNNSEQYVGIGWSRLSEGIKSNDFQEYYNRIKQESGKANPAINIFQNAKVDDLFWTRDLNGIYWICRVKSRAEVICDKLFSFSSFNGGILMFCINQNHVSTDISHQTLLQIHIE